MTSRVAGRGIDQPLTKEEVAPGVHSACHFASKQALGLFVVSALDKIRYLQDRNNDDIVLVEQEFGGVVVGRLDVSSQAPAFPGHLAPQSACRGSMGSFHLRVIHTLTTTPRDDRVHRRNSPVIQSALQLVDLTAALSNLAISVIQESSKFARGRRVPLLKRGSTRIRGDDPLLHEVWIGVGGLLHRIEVDKVEGTRALIPLNLGVFAQTVSFSQYSINDARTVLHANATHILKVVAEEGLACCTTFSLVMTRARFKTQKSRILLLVFVVGTVLFNNDDFGWRLLG